MDKPGRSALPRTTPSGRFPLYSALSPSQSYPPQPPHLAFNFPRNPILLLCISRRIIFRSICTSHLLLAFGTTATGEHHPSLHLHNRQAPLVLPHQPCCPCGGRRRATSLTSITIAITSIILATLTHHLASAIFFCIA